MTTVDELVGLLNQEGQKQRRRLTRQTSTKTCLMQYNIVEIIHCDFSLKCFFYFAARLLPIIFSFCIYISQGSVMTQFIFHFTFNSPENVSVKNEKSANIT